MNWIDKPKPSYPKERKKSWSWMDYTLALPMKVKKFVDGMIMNELMNEWSKDKLKVLSSDSMDIVAN